MLRKIGIVVETVSVVATSLIIWIRPGYLMVDAACTILLAVIALCNTIPQFITSVNYLM